MRTPFFSIIIPTYNREKMIGRAIESVLNQSFADWELIIVDDGSRDNTKAVVEQYSDERIKYIYQENAERSAARNNGISKATGEYMCFLDSDDYYQENRLDLLYKSISEEHLVAMYFTDMCIEQNGRIIHTKTIGQTEESIFNFLVNATIHSQQCCIHFSILAKEVFDKNIRVAEDLELWLRIATAFPVIYIPSQPTIVVVEHDSRTVGIGKIEAYIDHKNTYQYIFSKKYPISNALKNKKMHGVLMSIARCYFYKANDKRNTIRTVLNALKYRLFESGKEKAFLIYKSIF